MGEGGGRKVPTLQVALGYRAQKHLTTIILLSTIVGFQAIVGIVQDITNTIVELFCICN